ncbi:MAG: hypothetical protein FWF70_01595 [Bacteroidetes bacterium]|nr:hypothetical protein [Bacteroidota bacterium]MCL1969616.1 hypothetical protein [Bacteroidota bacterium]
MKDSQSSNAKELKWRYYNHALLPNCAPNEDAEIEQLKDKTIWKAFTPNRPLLACWTSHFDCGYETGWWYCILDKPFDITSISSNRRSKIKQTAGNFDVSIIDVKEYAEQMFDIHKSAYKTYNKTGTFNTDKNRFCEEVKQWENIVFGAFDKDSNRLAAYYRVKINATHIDLMTLKSDPDFEKRGVNLAIMYFVYNYFRKDIEQGKYLCGGSRNIYHQTNFQEFREKNFGFRKAYTHLHIQYAPFVAPLIKLLYPFRRIIHRLPFTIANQINGVLLMEKIRKRQKFDTK